MKYVYIHISYVPIQNLLFPRLPGAQNLFEFRSLVAALKRYRVIAVQLLCVYIYLYMYIKSAYLLYITLYSNRNTFIR